MTIAISIPDGLWTTKDVAACAQISLPTANQLAADGKLGTPLRLGRGSARRPLGPVTPPRVTR
jgi:hypothetical protein